MTDVVIVAAARSAIGVFNGSLSSLTAVEIGTQLLQGLIKRYQLPVDEIDQVILGQVLTAGCGQNPARQTTLNAGLPQSTNALTINHVCGSGLSAVGMAAQAIRCGDAHLVIAGGQESMSQSAHLLPDSRRGKRMGHGVVLDTMIHDGLWCAFNDYHMGITAENLVEKYQISRTEQDRFATQSQNRAQAAAERGDFDDQILPIHIQPRRGDGYFITKDEGIRPDCTSEQLAGLRPAFKPDGSVTAANASGLNDGAAMLALCSAETAEQLGLPVLARIANYSSCGVDPAIMGIGPAAAVRKCLQKTGWGLEQVDLIEANEAFAAQALAVSAELGLNEEKVNVNGGAIALGHPIGASGARVLVSLIHALQQRNAQKGIATLCIGGGMGVALAIERVGG